jgi:hypothetical protein
MAAKKQQKNKRRPQYTPLEKHKRVGKTLVTPWNDYNRLTPSSWVDERLPEYLWIAILTSCVDRDLALSTLREVLKYVQSKAPQAAGKLTHTRLSLLDNTVQQDVLRIITADDRNKEVLRSLLLFDHLPARNLWKPILDPLREVDSSPLIIAVARTLNHQSQQSTDCRWFFLASLLLAGKFHTPDREMIDGIFYYPNRGDVAKIIASIRANEIGAYNITPVQSEWPNNFWRECLAKTKCYSFPVVQPIIIDPSTSVQRVKTVYEALVRHMINTLSTTTIDAKHDTVFGMALFALAILMELLRMGNSTSILARSGLRTILECYITLNYLSNKNDTSLWQSFRIYGAGQAKLSYLKLDELEKNVQYVDKDSLEALANEDMWQELLNIDLGHWNNSDLRKMSEETNTKEYYDRYYSWTSAFSHGHWGPVRDAVLETCANPLHRLHRIPRSEPRMLPDVISDTIIMVDKIIDIVSNNYPSFDLRATLPQPGR